MTELRIRSSSFHEHGSSSGALGFDKCGSGSGALLFMAPNPAPASVRFNTLLQYVNCHGVPHVEWKVNLYQLHRTKRIYQTFLSNIIWYLFTSSALIMTKSAKKQQSQVQTIQITVITRNVTQDNGNINNVWKGSR